MQLPIFETVLNAVKVMGSIVGTRQDLQEVFRLHREGRTRVLYEKASLLDVNQAFTSVLQGTNEQPRLVFDMADLHRHDPLHPHGHAHTRLDETLLVGSPG